MPVVCAAILLITSCGTSATKPRPRVLVPDHPRSLTIAVYGGAPIHYQRTVRITRQHDIEAVVRDLDAMHHLRDERGHPCGLYRMLWYEILVFGYAHAPSLKVHLYAACPPTARARGIIAGGDQAFMRLGKLIDRLIGRRSTTGAPC